MTEVWLLGVGRTPWQDRTAQYFAPSTLQHIPVVFEIANSRTRQRKRRGAGKLFTWHDVKVIIQQVQHEFRPGIGRSLEDYDW